MTDHDLTPTYADLVHYADVGRRLTQAAGIALETHPEAGEVLQALRMPPATTPDAIIDAAIVLSDAAKEVKRR